MTAGVMLTAATPGVGGRNTCSVSAVDQNKCQCIEASESLVVPLLREDIRFEPMQGGRKRDTVLPPLARGQHPKGRILGQPLRVVGVLVTGQAAIDGQAKKIRQGELGVVSGAGDQ